jgi:hypothetical protein
MTGWMKRRQFEQKRPAEPVDLHAQPSQLLRKIVDRMRQDVTRIMLSPKATVGPPELRGLLLRHARRLALLPVAARFFEQRSHWDNGSRIA